MVDMRFIERVIEEGPRKGTVQRILQWRDAPYAVWRDVPLVTLEDQQSESEHSQAS